MVKRHWSNKQFLNLKLFKLKRSIKLGNEFRFQGFVKLKKNSLFINNRDSLSKFLSNPNKAGFINPILGLKLNLKNEFILDSNFILYGSNISFNFNDNLVSYLNNELFISNYLNIKNRLSPVKPPISYNKHVSLYFFRLSKLKNIMDMLILIKS